MTNDQAVKIKQDLPDGLLLPGTKIQIQEKVGGGGEQIEITIDKLSSMHATKSMEDDSYQSIVGYKTAGGLELTFDRRNGQWRRIIHGGKVDPNPVEQFIGHTNRAELIWVFPL